MWPDTTTVKPTLAELEAADLSAAKSQRITTAKKEANSRIYSAYPAYAQSNAALGIYNSLSNTDPFFPANMTAGIQEVITAEHAAEIAINALTTSAAVDAFTW